MEHILLVNSKMHPMLTPQQVCNVNQFIFSEESIKISFAFSTLTFLMAVFLDESGSDSVKSISNGSSCSSFSDFGISDESSKHGKHRQDDELSALSEVRNRI